MYLDHWGLERGPFEAQPDSRFLFATEPHRQALATLSYAACSGGEPLLLRGPTGCGKTLLLRALRRQLPREQYHVAFIPEAGGARVSLLRRVAYHLVHKIVDDPAAAMDLILQAARDAEQNHGALVLMCDDWPAAARRETLEELRWLLNLDIEGCRICVLLGAVNLRPEDHWPAWLAQRLLTTVTIGGLTATQVPEYLEHRMQTAARPSTAGAKAHSVFTPDAAALIADWSGGVPRLINRAAHLALHLGYLDLAQRIEGTTVQRALQRLARPAAVPAAPHGDPQMDATVEPVAANP